MKLRTVAVALVVAGLAGAGVTLAVQALFFGGGESLHLQTESMGGFDGQVFIVNFDPADPDLHAFCSDATPIYAIAFVDADTDRSLGVLGEDSPSPSCHEGITGITPGAVSSPDTPNPRETPGP
jgi:hypothetical protein